MRRAAANAARLREIRSVRCAPELGALVEQYKADGKESAGLELALEALPDDPAEGEK